ncbi:tripartite tricarboxylate transporter substrate binding protein [Pigmentiphaga soli]|uniref:Tripartite tricarboxylate transporter substrate binding protein n=1 Tax=Pigmentiphaga soli TaxID=1007095 RepID=A0ABP8GLN4_9BURK
MMPRRKRRFLMYGVVAGLACALAPAITRATQPGARWPDRPVRIVNPFAVGSGSDVVARLVAEKLSQRFGQPFVVENRPGANAVIGTSLVSKAAPDGYTLLAGGSTSHPANLALFKSLPYDPVEDFAPVAFMVSVHYYLVVPEGSSFHTLQDLIRYAKANPQLANYGTGNASTTVAMELLNLFAGTKFERVNYKGNTLAANDLLGGSLTTTFLDTSTAAPYLTGARMRALGVTAARRSSIFPDVPTMAELGYPGITMTAWNAVWAPAGTPRPIVDSLNAAINDALKMPDVADRIKALGFTFDGPGSRPEDLDRFVKSEIRFWARAVKQAGIPPLQ